MSKLNSEQMAEATRLAEGVMDIVLKVATRRLVQTVEEVHDTQIQPLRTALKGCQTLTPSLMDGSAAIERLKEINNHVYRALEKR